MKKGIQSLLFTITLVSFYNITSLYAQLDDSGESIVRVVFFAATDDGIIGDGVKESLRKLEEEFRDIEKYSGDNESYDKIKVEFYKFYGNECNLNEYNKLIERLKGLGKSLENDALIFYFIGHGFSHEIKDAPNLLFKSTSNGKISDNELVNNHKNLEDIHEELKSLFNRPRLIISIGEACNADINKRNNAKQDSSKLSIDLNPMPPIKVQPVRYQELFQKTAGDLMIYSSRKGTYSFVSDKDGGIFSVGFIKGLRDVVTSTLSAHWKDVFDNANVETFNISEKADLEDQYAQFPVASDFSKLTENYIADEPVLDRPTVDFIEKVLYAVKGKNKRDLRELLSVWKDVVAGTSPPSGFLKELDESELFRGILPLQTQWLLAYLYERKGDDKKAYLHYSAACLVIENDKESDSDKVITAKIDKEVPRSNSNLANEIRASGKYGNDGNMYDWLEHKQRVFANMYKDKLTEKKNHKATLVALASEYQGKVTEISAKIDDLEDTKKVIQQKINNNIKTIEGINKEIEGAPSEVSYKFAYSDKIKTKDENDFIAFIKCVESGTAPEDCPVTATVATLVETATISYETNPKRLKSLRNETGTDGIPIGDFCSEGIKINTRTSLLSTIVELQKIPDSYLSSLIFEIDITGYADWRGFGKKFTKPYYVSSDINEYYIDRFGVKQKISLSASEPNYITNEQLAFLRAYCAYEEVIRVLEEAGKGLVSSTQFKIKFSAIESDDKDNDDLYRSVNVKVYIPNQKQYLFDAIKEIEGTNEDLKEEMIEIDSKIKILEGEKEIFLSKIKDLQDEIEVETEEIADIKYILEEYGLKGERTKKEIR